MMVATGAGWWKQGGVKIAGQTAVWLLLCLARTTQAYQIVTVLGEKEFCNDTVWVDGGAILRLTDKPAYTFTPFTCFITFMAPQHTWSGLTGVLEDVNLRKYHDEADHHMAQNQCVDYIKVVTDTGVPQGEQCGTWGVAPGQQLSQMGYQRALVGYCPTPPDNGASDMRCGVSKLTVQVSVGMKDNPVWRHKTWPSHRGFTFVVTSYRYQYRESECAADLRSCSAGNGDPPYCVHNSLWCDRHINCGHPLNNLDETSCLRHEMLDNVLTVLAGPWVVVVLLLGVVVAGAAYWRRTRLPIPAHHPIAAASSGPHPAQEMNSYAESYEVSSTLSTAPHMAIQVRVVCSPGQLNSSNHHHHHNYQVWPGSTTTTTTTIDLPPAYDSLFPHGPPPPPPPPPAYPPSNSSHSLNSDHSATNVNASTTTTTPTTDTPTTSSSTTTVATTGTTTITTTSQLSLAVNNTHHNSASLSTTIVANAESANAEATTTTTIGLGTNTATTTAAPTNIPPAATTTTIPCLSASPSSSISATTTTTIRGPTPINIDKPSSDLSELEKVEIVVDEHSKPPQLPQHEPPPQASHFLPELQDLPPHDAEYPPPQPQPPPPPRPTHPTEPDPHQLLPPPSPQSLHTPSSPQPLNPPSHYKY